MKTLILINMGWNSCFVLMAASEMLGVTAIHGKLPWWFKWWWVIALATGNLVIHFLMLWLTK